MSFLVTGLLVVLCAVGLHQRGSGLWLPILVGLVGVGQVGGGRGSAGFSAATAVGFLVLFVLAALGFAQNPAFLPIGGLRLRLAVGFAWRTTPALRSATRPKSATR